MLFVSQLRWENRSCPLVPNNLCDDCQPAVPRVKAKVQVRCAIRDLHVEAMVRVLCARREQLVEANVHVRCAHGDLLAMLTNSESTFIL